MFILLITDRYYEVSNAIPVKVIRPKYVAQLFLKHWVANYGPSL